MGFRALGLLAASGLVAALGSSFACSGNGAGAPAVAPASEGYPEAMLEQSWSVRLGANEERAPFEARRGWVQLVVKRDVRGCVADLGGDGGLPAARCHADAASIYKQAALLYANALIAGWGNMGEPTDPVEGAHLLSVSHAITGDLERARAEDLRLGEPAGDVAAWHAPWRAWLASGATWPPDLSGLPIGLPEVAGGEWPTGKPTPHFTLYETTEEKRSMEASDLSQLIALALWHQAAARAAHPEGREIEQYGAQYRLPVEGPAATDVELPMEFVFGSDYLVGADAAFLADLLGAGGVGAVEAHKERSLLAALALQCRVEGKIDPERAIDLASETRRLTLARLKDKAGGNTEGFHRTFADIARVTVLRGLALVAETEGDREVSGRLRILALESSDQEWTADAAALLSMAAWDASNEYPVRATDTLHNLIRRFPTLEPARFGVDVLALRVSRRRGGGLPGQ